MARKHRDVMRVLIADIASGRRVAGEMLPREVDLAAEFEVSRGVARETIRALEERGLISVKHGKGATVNQPASWDVFDPDVLAASLESEHSADVLGEYLECRRIVEVEAAGMAAERAGKREIENLAAALEGMEHEAARPPSQAAEERFHEADIRFHQALVAATGNRALAQLVERIHSALLLARFPLARPEHREEIALPEHRRIHEAVAASDVGEARQAMSDHLDTVVSYLSAHRAQRSRGRRPKVRGKVG
jgi:DNA-binding FadR family transcriptional regulator